MKKELSLINFSNPEFGNVRALLIDDEPWFVGKDVALALGYLDHKNALKDHVDGEDKKRWRIATPSRGKQQATIINESGLYSLILGSRLLSAKKFKRWVTSEVLPAIRKTGSYSVVRDERWEETRLGTKASHKPFTSAIQLLISHLRNHGEERPNGYIYGHLTNIIQTACDIRRGERDFAPVANLNKLDQVQSMIANLVLQLLASRPDIQSLEQFEATIILQLDAFKQLLSGQCPLLAGR